MSKSSYCTYGNEMAWHEYKQQMADLKSKRHNYSSKTTYIFLLKVIINSFRPKKINKRSLDNHTKNIVNAIFNPDHPETYNEIEEAWKRHKAFFRGSE